MTRLGGFLRDSSGVTPVEFAIVGSLFLLLLFGILGVALLFVGNMTLENAVDQGARLIRTGEAQNQGFDATRFKTEVCKYLTAPLSCSGVKLEVQNCGATLVSCLQSPPCPNANTSYDPGVGGDFVKVRAYYEWDLLANLPILPIWKSQNVNTRLSTPCLQNGDRELIATVVFRNEPFKPQ
jgi:Flp pilus assembly protein TadG